MLQNLVQILEKRAQEGLSRLTFVNPSGRNVELPYAELYRKSLAAAAKLRAIGVKPGDVVALLLPTCPEFIVSFFAIEIAGAIPVAIYPPLKLGKIGEWQQQTIGQLRSVKAVVIVTDSQIRSILGSVVAGADTPFGAVVASELVAHFTDDLSQSSYELGPLQIPIHETAFLQFSSGTTGSPKPVAISHINVLRNVEAISNGLKVNPEDLRCVSWLPLYHDMGLVGVLLTSIWGNCHLALIRPEHFIGVPLFWLKTISAYKANIAVAPNFAYSLCVRRTMDADIRELDLSSLKIALCGAEVIHPEALNDFAEKFASVGFSKTAFTPVYGMAEATLAVTFSQPDVEMDWIEVNSASLQPGKKVELQPGGSKLALVGTPVLHTQVEVRDEMGAVLPEQFVGTIWISGLSVTNENLVDGWLDSGDYGFFVKGQLCVVGRKKETLIIRGRNYDPTLIERSLAGFGELREGCIVAFSTTRFSTETEDLVIVAELKKGLTLSPADRENLKKRMTGVIASDQQLTVKQIDFSAVGSLPRTSSGKIKRRKTKELWEAGTLSQSSGAGSRVSILWHVVKSKVTYLKLKVAKLI